MLSVGVNVGPFMRYQELHCPGTTTGNRYEEAQVSGTTGPVLTARVGGGH